MITRFGKDVYLGMTVCGGTTRLSIPGTFGLFIDLATEHAEAAGIGATMMQQTGLFWVNARQHVHFYSFPRLNETIHAETFLGTGRGPKVMRYYRLSREGKVLVEGRAEFVAVNARTGQFMSVDDFYPSEEELPRKENGERDTACEDLPAYAFTRIDPDFSAAQDAGSYTVRSVDIDLGGHMDHVQYMYAVMGLFTCEALKQYRFNDIDIVYRKPCFEGEVLTARKRQVCLPQESAEGSSLPQESAEGSSLPQAQGLEMVLEKAPQDPQVAQGKDGREAATFLRMLHF